MDLEALVRRQHGVVSTEQALAAGITEDALRWRVDSGRWTRIGHGLYRAQTGPLDWMGRAHALVLRGREGVALGLSAAEYLHGVASRPPPVITFHVPRGRRVVRLPGARTRSATQLEVVRRRGLPVTSAATSVLDLAEVSGTTWREAVGTAARWVQKRRTTTEEIAAALERRRRHRHRQVLLAALGIVAEGAESLLEIGWVRRVERAHGLPPSCMQVRDGSVRRDFEYEAWGVVVEVDGRLGHEGEHVSRDRRRDRRTASTGRVTLRAGWFEVEGDPCELAADVVLTLRSRGPGVAARPCGPRCVVARLLVA